MAEKERLRLTSDGFGLTSCNSYMNSFIRKQAEEQTEKNIKVIENFDSFIPYNTENKQKLAEAFIRILYASNTAEIINNIKVIISFHQYLRMSKFATNTNTGLSTGLQFFQNTQEGGKTTIVMAHKRAMNELGLTTCLSDLTKISGIYNSENGIQTSHICYYPEET
jgi:adenylyl- and sulfurtransferase ThiI